MAFDYSRLVSTGRLLIERFGRPVTLRVRAEAALPDTDKPWEPDSAADFTEYNTYAAFVPVNWDEADRTLVLSTDETFYMNVSADMPVDIDIRPGDEIEDATSTLRVVVSQVIRPATITVLLSGVARR